MSLILNIVILVTVKYSSYEKKAVARKPAKPRDAACFCLHPMSLRLLYIHCF